MDNYPKPGVDRRRHRLVFVADALAGAFYFSHTGPHTTASAWCTPLLEDFWVPRVRLSSPTPRFRSRRASTPFDSAPTFTRMDNYPLAAVHARGGGDPTAAPPERGGKEGQGVVRVERAEGDGGGAGRARGASGPVRLQGGDARGILRGSERAADSRGPEDGGGARVGVRRRGREGGREGKGGGSGGGDDDDDDARE